MGQTKTSILIALICGIVLLQNNGTFSSPINSPESVLHHHKNSSFRCGGYLTGNKGNLTFKASVPLQDNERCVWVVRAENAWEYNVTVEAPPHISPNASLYISGFFRATSEHWWPNDELKSHTFWSPNLIIVFYTGPKASQSGQEYNFTIEWEVLENGEVHPDSRDYLISSNDPENPINFTYPQGKSEYDNNEHSAIILVPENNFNDERCRPSAYFSTSGWEDYWDRFRYYYLTLNNRNWPDWVLTDSLGSPGNPLERLMVHDDMILMVFQSDDRNTGVGFNLTTIYSCY